MGADEESRRSEEGSVRKGVASIALLPCGSLSGHFIQLPHSLCFGLHGTGTSFVLCLFFVFLITKKEKIVSSCYLCLHAIRDADEHSRVGSILFKISISGPTLIGVNHDLRSS